MDLIGKTIKRTYTEESWGGDVWIEFTDGTRARFFGTGYEVDGADYHIYNRVEFNEHVRYKMGQRERLRVARMRPPIHRAARIAPLDAIFKDLFIPAIREEMNRQVFVWPDEKDV